MRLRDDLDHLPETQRRELELAVRILFEEFSAALGVRPTQDYKRDAAILKVVLFGSFARGDWVEDRVNGYLSDYDLLVVVNHDKLTDLHDYWGAAGDRFVRALTIERTLRRPVNFIVHTLADVNDQLKRGRPFFLDIVRDGIALYEAPNHPLETPRVLAPEAARAEAQGYFDEWFGTAVDFERGATFYREDGKPKLAAFMLHQATERFYHCVLLVLTLYSPRAHKLDVLRSLAEDLDARLIAAWPREDRVSRRGFDRIRRAYVEARYSPHYKITPEELAFAFEHVGQLATLVDAICRERLTRDTKPPSSS